MNKTNKNITYNLFFLSKTIQEFHTENSFLYVPKIGDYFLCKKIYLSRTFVIPEQYAEQWVFDVFRKSTTVCDKRMQSTNCGTSCESRRI